jgi:hypothetical protein
MKSALRAALALYVVAVPDRCELGRGPLEGDRRGGREIGHLHGDHVADFGFPRDDSSAFPGTTRRACSSRNGSTITPSFRASGLVPGESTGADVLDVIALVRLNYERAVARHGLPTEAAT